MGFINLTKHMSVSQGKVQDSSLNKIKKVQKMKYNKYRITLIA